MWVLKKFELSCVARVAQLFTETVYNLGLIELLLIIIFQDGIFAAYTKSLSILMLKKYCEKKLLKRGPQNSGLNF